MIETEFRISPQHPSLAGHFPGHPVVPGVVILDEIMRCIKQHQAGREISAIPSVKFSAPLLPDMTVRLSIHQQQPDLFKFTCRVAEQLICSGQMRSKL